MIMEEGTLTDKKQATYWVKSSFEHGFEKAKYVQEKLELYKYQFMHKRHISNAVVSSKIEMA